MLSGGISDDVLAAAATAFKVRPANGQRPKCHTVIFTSLNLGWLMQAQINHCSRRGTINLGTVKSLGP